MVQDPAFDDPALSAFFANNEDKLISDPVAYGSWFGQADERARHKAVGAHRYEALQVRVGRAPAWAEFIDDDGELVALKRIENESHAERADRFSRVQGVLAKRAEAIRSIQTFGFLRG